MHKKRGFWYRFLIQFVVYWAVFGVAIATIWTLTDWPIWGKTLFTVGAVFGFLLLILLNEVIRLHLRLKALETAQGGENG